MYGKSVLSPTSGSYFLCTFTTLKKKGGKYVSEYNFPVAALQFSKDLSGPTGDGTLTTPYLQGQESLIRQGQLIQIRGAWDLNRNSKVLTNSAKDKETCICYGAVKKVKLQRTTMDIEFTDMGILLEAAGTASEISGKHIARKKAVKRIIDGTGLIGVLDWGSNVEDYLYLTETDTGGSATSTSLVPTNTGSGTPSGCVSYTGYPTCSNKAGHPEGYVKTGPHYWDNRCPFPNCDGTLKAGIKRKDEVTCDKCKADFCGRCGKEKMDPARKWMTKCTGSTEGDVSAGYSAVGSTNHWDILTELLNPNNVDLMAYVKGKYLHIKEPPAPSAVKLWVDDEVNLIKDSVTVTEADPTTPNTIIVNYGKSAVAKSVKAVNKKMVTQYGTISQKYDKPDLNATQAKAYAEKMLNRLERNNGFAIDCTVIYHPYFYVGEWCKFTHRSLGIDDVFMITKTNMKLASKSTPKVDLTLADYVPFISGGGGSGGSQGMFAQMDLIGEKEAQFPSKQGGCHKADCVELSSGGDCWASSEWLYLRLNNAGINARIVGYASGARVSYPRHSWVQVNVGNGWVDWDYKKYNSQHKGNVSPGAATRVLISEGKTSAAQVDIYKTGY